MKEGREAITPDLQPRPSAGYPHARLSLPANKTSSGVRSSATWTSTSGDLGGLSDTDEIGDRLDFVEEYNRIAKKVSFAGLKREVQVKADLSQYGIRPLVPDNPGSLDVGWPKSTVKDGENIIPTDIQRRLSESFQSADGGRAPSGEHPASLQSTASVVNAAPAMSCLTLRTPRGTVSETKISRDWSDCVGKAFSIFLPSIPLGP